MNREIEYHLKLVEEKFGIDSDNYRMEKLAMDNVQELLDVLDKQGHSGTSVHYVKNKFNRLVDGKVLSPLTGGEGEWGSSGQNKRMSSVFRENLDNSTAHDISARIFTDNGGRTFFQTGRVIDGVSGFKPVTFPYMPPTEPEKYYIEVIDGVEKIIKTENVEEN